MLKDVIYIARPYSKYMQIVAIFGRGNIQYEIPNYCWTASARVGLLER